VHTPDGKLDGVSRITRVSGGCVLHERDDAGKCCASGSLDVYDAGRRVRHQARVGDGGTLLLPGGGLRGGAMVSEGQETAADGKVMRHRITWMPNADGSVRQHWESTDASGRWTNAFGDRYTRE